MTCKEKFTSEYPGFHYMDFCPDDARISTCPDYCYEGASDDICERCWNREIPEEIKKEKSMINTKKTKAELLNEIAELERQIKDLEKYKEIQNCADDLKAVHTSLITAGFSNDQAFELLRTTLANLIPGMSKGMCV